MRARHRSQQISPVPEARAYLRLRRVAPVPRRPAVLPRRDRHPLRLPAARVESRRRLVPHAHGDVEDPVREKRRRQRGDGARAVAQAVRAERFLSARGGGGVGFGGGGRGEDGTGRVRREMGTLMSRVGGSRSDATTHPAQRCSALRASSAVSSNGRPSWRVSSPPRRARAGSTRRAS